MKGALGQAPDTVGGVELLSRRIGAQALYQPAASGIDKEESNTVVAQAATQGVVGQIKQGGDIAATYHGNHGSLQPRRVVPLTLPCGQRLSCLPETGVLSILTISLWLPVGYRRV